MVEYKQEFRDLVRTEMSKKKLWTDKEIYDFASVALNVYMAGAAIIFVVYVVTPLLGGKLFFKPLILYGSWIGIGLFLKLLVKRVQKGLRIRPHQYVSLCLYNIACMFLWFRYPINVFLSVLTIVGIAFAYKAQQRRLRPKRTRTSANK